MTILEFQKGGIYKYQLPITEKNRGQINVGISFIKENRLYSTDRSIVVPWTNKDLRISIESFREKIVKVKDKIKDNIE
jgi:hypothetical protein